MCIHENTIYAEGGRDGGIPYKARFARQQKVLLAHLKERV